MSFRNTSMEAIRDAALAQALDARDKAIADAKHIRETNYVTRDVCIAWIAGLMFGVGVAL